MSVAGKKKHEFVAQTLCDFGDPTRREVIRDHFSLEAAFRAFDDLKKIYGRKDLGRNERCWQETVDGEIINDNLA